MSRIIICSLITLLLAFELGTALAKKKTETTCANQRILKINCPIIVVDPSGRGDFRSIQSAIDSVPCLNHNWTCICVQPGVYRERVSMPIDKPFIYLAGAGQRRTYVVSDGHEPLDSTATLTTRAENTLVEGISFNNSYNAMGSHNNMKAAVAARVEGDKTAFRDCGFYGLQDTLWDFQGRHYFKQCIIEGAVDFIFGSGQSIYDKCVISVISKSLRGEPGYITSQSRDNPNQTNGFVFKYCNIKGNGMTFLGRPWRDYARVIFFRTFMSDIIVPQGWDIWFSKGKEGQLTFEEIDCKGLGANTSRRVKWANKPMCRRELQHFLSLSDYVNREGWLLPEFINYISSRFQ